MIARESVNQIFQTAQIDEVVGEFVSLKKRGVNLVANCPFHDEKTPSFHVSPSKGIFKCFGCGAGGNSVNFLIQHEKVTYPEALRFLAKKYNIAIEETEDSEEYKAAQTERESLLVITSYAQKYFSGILLNNEEGRAIGLSYFKEREIGDDLIEKFQLGYSLESWDGFTKTALGNAFNTELLEKTGLTIIKEDKTYDRFRGRVMFPIHDVSGRCIGFGGRILKKSEKAAKYVNSPESEIYHKSNVLYGIHLAKKSIVKNDNFYLVEGYTDVIALHKAGIENVVASSGTSLTEGQIRLVKRFTKNITILYDGDEAGIKASLRGINLVLDEGLNVKVVPLPDGEDPDSYSSSIGSDEFVNYLKNNAEDFIRFKTLLFKKEASNDPHKLSEAISDTVESIAHVQDPITRAIYIKDTSILLEIPEDALLKKLNFFIRNKKRKTHTQQLPATQKEEVKIIDPVQSSSSSDYVQERYIVKLLLNYGNEEIRIKTHDNNTDDDTYITMNLTKYIVNEITNNSIEFENPTYSQIYNEFANSDSTLNASYFSQHQDPKISQLTADLLSTRYEISKNWKDKYDIFVPKENDNLSESVISVLNLLKFAKVKKMIKQIKDRLENVSSPEEYNPLLEVQNELITWKKELSESMRAVVIK
ncbi:MAG: DNA primase [Bacteroidetes bacterium]|nr:MAG: DNA primase [Bacteroidota bacterium]